jgi:NADPH:quinone reductase-like Zn-dependent oxidoreductase
MERMPRSTTTPRILPFEPGKLPKDDVILDHIGARYLPRHISALATGGRLVNIGSMGGLPAAELDMGAVLSRRLQIIGTTLRARPREEKAEIVRQFLARFGDDLRAGRIHPAIHHVFPFDQAAEAHRLMKSNEHFGKLVLRVR